MRLRPDWDRSSNTATTRPSLPRSSPRLARLRFGGRQLWRSCARSIPGTCARPSMTSSSSASCETSPERKPSSIISFREDTIGRRCSLRFRSSVLQWETRRSPRAGKPTIVDGYSPATLRALRISAPSSSRSACRPWCGGCRRPPCRTVAGTPASLILGHRTFSRNKLARWPHCSIL